MSKLYSDFIKLGSRRNEVISFVKSGAKDLPVSRTTIQESHRSCRNIWLINKLDSHAKLCLARYDDRARQSLYNLTAMQARGIKVPNELKTIFPRIGG